MTARLIDKPAPKRPKLEALLKGTTGKECRVIATDIPAERQPIYGHPALNFARQAMVWNGLLGNKLVVPITAEDVAIMMAAVKLTRLIHTPTHEDSIADVSGYMTCLEQVSADRRGGVVSAASGLVEGTLADKAMDADL